VKFPRHGLSPKSRYVVDQDRLFRADVPDRYWEDEVKDIPDSCSYKAAIRGVVAELHKNDPEGRAPIFWGDYGYGKTSAAVMIMRAVMQRALCSCYFVSACDVDGIFRHRWHVKDDDGELRYDRIQKSQWLILDDWGAERQADWSEAYFQEIISARYNWRRPKIITTNMDPDELVKRSKRFGSLIGSVYDLIEVGGRNWRDEGK
jgi:DNA replication protein DnaC